jgi:exopolysaccharide biosynthesis polyprenyl glycosylphosphotransferase
MHWGHPCRHKVTLFLGDIGLITLVSVAGWYVYPAGTSDAVQKALSLAVLLTTFVGALYVFDLYSMVEFNRLGMLFRVMIAVGAASVVCNAFFHLFQLEIPGSRSMEMCAAILPVVAYVWRKCYLHNSLQYGMPERLVAIGTARDTEILKATINPTNPRYDLLGMFRAEPEWRRGFEKQVDAEGLRYVSGAADILASPSYSVTATAMAAATAVAMAREPEIAVCLPLGIAEAAERSEGAEGAEGGEAVADVVPDRTPDFAPDLAPDLVPDLGAATPENLLRVVATQDVKAIVVRNDAMTFELAEVLTRLRFNGIQVYSLPDFCMRSSEELPLEILNEFWLCVADGFDLLQARFFRRIKRLADVVLAAAGLAAAAPFMLAAAVAVWLDSPGPILFRQQRVGWMGRPFELLKFRSMGVGAEKARGAQWAVVNDPRVTKVGRILRKTHFDELPQMINILRGEMSFVGPRPERPEFVGLLNESIGFYHLLHYVLPGITGWAQVNYPYGASMDDARRKLQYDLYYVCNASPLLDLRTLLRTARVVLFRRGSR